MKENNTEPHESNVNEIDDIVAIPSSSDLEPPETSTNSQTFRFSCKKCGKGFNKKGYAEKHCKKNKSWTCPMCCKVIEYKKNVKRHEISCEIRCKPKAITNTRSFKCKECGLVCANKSNLERHELNLHGILSTRTHTCVHAKCRFASNSSKELKRHVTLKHSEKNSIPCLKCDRQYESLAGLRKHRREEHGISCDLCSLMFSSDSKLKQHKMQAHRTFNNNVSVVVSRKIGEHAVHKMIHS